LFDFGPYILHLVINIPSCATSASAAFSLHNISFSHLSIKNAQRSAARPPPVPGTGVATVAMGLKLSKVLTVLSLNWVRTIDGTEVG